MALKALLLKKQIDNKNKALEALRAKLPGFVAREDELSRAIDEVETDEQRGEVEGLITAFETERRDNAEAISALEGEIRELEDALTAEEAAQQAARQAAEEPADTTDQTRSVNTMANITRILSRATLRDRVSSIATREEVREFAVRLRNLIGQKRAVTGGAVTIPEVMLPLIREEVNQASKLLKHVNLQHVRGNARQTIMGTIPEAVWTEMCAKLNELDPTFNDAEIDGYKVGAFVAICNALKEDNDVELLSQVLYALAHAEAQAIDKAILYGTGTKMPKGIVTRLVETSAPEDPRATDRPWTDLHTSNVITISSANSTGIKLFQSLMAAYGAAKKRYGDGGKFWAMNEKTHMTLMSEAMNFNAAGAIVSGMNDTMPVIGGDVEELDFIPDNVIIAGHGINYVMAERAGRQVALSEEVRFIEDQTVVKSTARYDGLPVIPEAFVAIGINNTSVSGSRTFPTDYANAAMNDLTVTAAAGTAAGDTVLTVSGTLAQSDPVLKYKLGAYDFSVGDAAVGFSSLTSGTTQITAAAGKRITVVELDASGKVVSQGVVVSVPKT